jgi:hypothetical protein
MRRRWWLAIGVGLIAVAAVALAVALAGNGDSKQRESSELNHEDFARLFAETRVGDEMDATLTRWPKDPYQHYSDNLADDCYEWSDTPLYLYNLCFKYGVVRTKDIVG